MCVHMAACMWMTKIMTCICKSIKTIHYSTRTHIYIYIYTHIQLFGWKRVGRWERNFKTIVGITNTTIAFESSWWASSSFTAILAILWERTFWRMLQSAFFQRLFGISLKPKPRRNAPVTSPNVFDKAIAKPRIPPLLST